MSEIRRDDNKSRTWNTRIKQNIHFPLKSYSPWSLVSSTIKLNTKLPPHCPLMLRGLGYKFDFVSSLFWNSSFEYNLSNNWWFVIFNCFKIMFKMSHYQWLHMVRNLEYVWKIHFEQWFNTPTSLRFLCRDAREFSLAWWHRKWMWKTLGFTALFTNMRTLKFISRIHNCVFHCRQS